MERLLACYYDGSAVAHSDSYSLVFPVLASLSFLSHFCSLLLTGPEIISEINPLHTNLRLTVTFGKSTTKELSNRS